MRVLTIRFKFKFTNNGNHSKIDSLYYIAWLQQGSYTVLDTQSLIFLRTFHFLRFHFKWFNCLIYLAVVLLIPLRLEPLLFCLLPLLLALNRRQPLLFWRFQIFLVLPLKWSVNPIVALLQHRRHSNGAIERTVEWSIQWRFARCASDFAFRTWK